MDIIREAELEDKVDARDLRYKQNENIRGVEVNKLEKMFQHDDRLLRVYIDPDRDEYYIDTFAAHSIGLMSYQHACAQYESGIKYYKISLSELNMLKRIFKDKIMYEIFPGARIRKENEREAKLLDNSERFIGNDFDKEMFNNKKESLGDIGSVNYENPDYDKIDINKIDTSSIGDIKDDYYRELIDQENVNKINPDEYSGSNMKR